MSAQDTPIRVVLVEDEALHRERFTQAIRQDTGLSLQYVAENAKQMLAWLSTQEPEVLLVDLGLPDLPGLDVIQFCVARWPRTHIAVLTMFEDEQRVISSIEAGASGYLLKHALHDEIPVLIRQLYAGGAPMSPAIARYVLTRLRKPALAAPPNSYNAEDANVPYSLTEREVGVLNLIARGFKSAEIAEIQNLSVNTINTHIRNIYGKLAVHSKTEAVFEAGKCGLIQT